MDAAVTKALPNAMFEVELENGHKLIAYAAGRMRRYFIRITPGTGSGWSFRPTTSVEVGSSTATATSARLPP